MRVLIAGGGTGGHLYPGIALARELQRRDPSAHVSFVGTALFWRIYIYRSGELLPAAIAAAPHPDRLAVSALTAHLLMMAGVVATAVGDELVIAHPLGHTPPAWIAAIPHISVTREEYDVQVQVLARTREKLAALEARLAQLEARPK